VKHGSASIDVQVAGGGSGVGVGDTGIPSTEISSEKTGERFPSASRYWTLT
jgi:hypothetical protein